LSAAALVTLATRSAAAREPASGTVDAEVTSDSSAQLYELRSPSGQTIIARRRLTTSLGVAAYDLLSNGDDPRAPSLTFRARLRYDADYGGSTDETNIDRPDRLVPGLSRGPIDLMYGYVEGRRFARGVLGFRLGRQYVTDALGWWSFDGGLVRVTTPYYVAAEAYGGLEQRGGLFLSTPRFERDGVWRGDRSGYERDPSLYPSFQPSDVAPAFGGALEAVGLGWLQARASYRRVYNTGASNVAELGSGLRAPVTYDRTRVSQERVGGSIGVTASSLGGAKAGVAYDLYVKKVASLFVSADWFASRAVTVSVDYDFYRPTFDGDSIWNYFLAMPMNDVGLRGSWDPTRRVALAGGVHARVFEAETAPAKDLGAPTSPNGLSALNEYPSSAFEPTYGGDLSARYRIGEGHLGARGAADVASSGDRVGLDVFGERVLETRYVLQARTGVWMWKDDLRPDRDAVDFGYVLGAGYELLPRSTVLADFQHDMNRVAGQRFRAMLWLSIALTSGR
jgi:hypothetical protein